MSNKKQAIEPHRGAMPGNDALHDAIEAGSEITGNVGGAVLGMLVAGPPGAIVGAGTGPVIARSLRWAAEEFRSRITGPREAARAGAVFGYALESTNELLEAGDQPRSDGFFETEISSGRTAANEIAEGVLLAAQRSHEERKLPLLGRLLAAIAFDESISQPEANSMIALVSRLSYQQLCLLQSIELKSLQRSEDFHEAGSMSYELVGLLADVKELYDLSLIVAKDGRAMLGMTDFRPSVFATQVGCPRFRCQPVLESVFV